MYCYPNDPKNPPFQSNDYTSGQNVRSTDCGESELCQDNPEAEDVGFMGPIPTGSYDIESNNPGSSKRNLTPRDGTDTHGRTAFQMHGCGDPDNCSQGCVAATTNQARDELNKLLSLEEGNNVMIVISGPGQ